MSVDKQIAFCEKVYPKAKHSDENMGEINYENDSVADVIHDQLNESTELVFEVLALPQDFQGDEDSFHGCLWNCFLSSVSNYYDKETGEGL